jgi:hypothetical protein
MVKRSILTGGLSILFVGLLAACGSSFDKNTPEKAQQRLQTNFQSYTEPLKANFELLEESELFSGLMTSEAGSGVSEGSDSESENTTTTAGLTSSQDDEIQNRSENSSPGNRSNRGLGEQLLLPEENLESSSGDSLTYMFGGETLCNGGGPFQLSGNADAEGAAMESGEESANSSAEPATPSVPEGLTCEEVVEAVVPRLQFQLVGNNGLRIKLLVSEQKHALLTMESQPSQLSLSADLGSMKSGLQAIEDALPEEDLEEELFDLPNALSGKMKLVLERLGEKKAAISATIPKEIEVVTDTVEFSMGKAEPLMKILGDATKKQMTLTSTQAPTELQINSVAELLDSTTMDEWETNEIDTDSESDDSSEEESDDSAQPASEALELKEGVDLSALFRMEPTTDKTELETVVDLDKETVETTSVPTEAVVELDDATVFKLNAGDGDGDAYTATIESVADAEDTLKAVFEPGFDVSAEFAFEKIETKLKSSPDWMLNEVLNVSFKGSSPALQFENESSEPPAQEPTSPSTDDGETDSSDGNEESGSSEDDVESGTSVEVGSDSDDETPDWNELLQVSSGTLTLEGVEAEIEHTVEANKCLFAKSGSESGQHPLAPFKADTCSE